MAQIISRLYNLTNLGPSQVSCLCLSQMDKVQSCGREISLKKTLGLIKKQIQECRIIIQVSTEQMHKQAISYKEKTLHHGYQARRNLQFRICDSEQGRGDKRTHENKGRKNLRKILRSDKRKDGRGKIKELFSIYVDSTEKITYIKFQR